MIRLTILALSLVAPRFPAQAASDAIQSDLIRTSGQTQDIVSQGRALCVPFNGHILRKVFLYDVLVDATSQVIDR
jgi:hypothetical protein